MNQRKDLELMDDTKPMGIKRCKNSDGSDDLVCNICSWVGVDVIPYSQTLAGGTGGGSGTMGHGGSGTTKTKHQHYNFLSNNKNAGAIFSICQAAQGLRNANNLTPSSK